MDFDFPQSLSLQVTSDAAFEYLKIPACNSVKYSVFVRRDFYATWNSQFPNNQMNFGFLPSETGSNNTFYNGDMKLLKETAKKEKLSKILRVLKNISPLPTFLQTFSARSPTGTLLHSYLSSSSTDAKESPVPPNELLDSLASTMNRTDFPDAFYAVCVALKNIAGNSSFSKLKLHDFYNQCPPFPHANHPADCQGRFEDLKQDVCCSPHYTNIFVAIRCENAEMPEEFICDGRESLETKFFLYYTIPDEDLSPSTNAVQREHFKLRLYVNEPWYEGWQAEQKTPTCLYPGGPMSIVRASSSLSSLEAEDDVKEETKEEVVKQVRKIVIPTVASIKPPIPKRRQSVVPEDTENDSGNDLLEGSTKVERTNTNKKFDTISYAIIIFGLLLLAFTAAVLIWTLNRENSING